MDYALWSIDATSIRASRSAAGAVRGKNRPCDPAEQALGRSRGGWGTKVHLVVDGGSIPLAATITAGQAHESKQVTAVLEAVRLPNGKGRPADLAAFSRFSRTLCGWIGTAALPHRFVPLGLFRIDGRLAHFHTKCGRTTLLGKDQEATNRSASVRSVCQAQTQRDRRSP